jgi:integrase
MLTAKKVERTKQPGRHRDGLVKGLLLQISKNGAKSWVLRYELRGREHMLGLGSVADFNLKEARERARAQRQLLADGIDPLSSKRAAQAAARQAAARALTFREAAERYSVQHEVKWTNARWRAQFLTSLKAHAFPVIGGMDVAAIDTAAVLRAIEPIWIDKAVTADRVRARIEQIIDWAIVRGHRPPGTNPAAWRGHLDQVLPAPRKVAPVQHHPAMAYTELPAFMETLRQQDGTAARAIELTILAAARTGEVLGAKWDEINFDTATWEIAAERMKSRREIHAVPLSPQAMELLRKLPREDGNPFVFIGPTAGSGLYSVAMMRAMRCIRQDVTIHGFRSTFRVWAAERTAYPREVLEQALAHAVGNQSERSYARTSLFDKRRKLMEQWAKFATTPPAKGAVVVPMRGRR